MFELGKWHKTKHGHDVEFIKPKHVDGLYNVFRHKKEQGYRPLYTDEQGRTAYGDRVLPHTTFSPPAPSDHLADSKEHQ